MSWFKKRFLITWNWKILHSGRRTETHHGAESRESELPDFDSAGNFGYEEMFERLKDQSFLKKIPGRNPGT